MSLNLLQRHLKLLNRWRSRWTALLLLTTTICAIVPAKAQASSPEDSVSPTVIVVGFVGGFVRANDERHPEVQMMQRIAQDNPNVHTVVFGNHSTETARKQILQWLDTDRDGRVSDAEKQRARIILLGHSWGGAAVVELANELDESHVPILLTIQLDSVNKPRGNDCAIPPNVERALNFYQTRGLAHGCQELEPMDPSRTQVVANLRFDYTAQPAECASYPWFDRHVLKTHNAMDCDPQVWSLVERDIRKQIDDVLTVRRAPETSITTPAGGFIHGGAVLKERLADALFVMIGADVSRIGYPGNFSEKLGISARERSHGPVALVSQASAISARNKLAGSVLCRRRST